MEMPSAGHYHSFAYTNIWDAVRLVQVLRSGGQFLSDRIAPDAVIASEILADAIAPNEADAVNDDRVKKAVAASDSFDKLEGASDLESEGDLETSAAGTGGRAGVAGVYTLADGVKIAVALVEHFAYRDPLLHACNFDEFVMAYKIEKVKLGAIDACNELHPAAGRPRGRAYRFVEPHPLRDSYVLREKAKFDVPVLVADPPPRLPAARHQNASRAMEQQREHARYYGAMFIPWHAGGSLDVSPAAWQHHVAWLASSAAQDTSDPQEMLSRDIARGRY